MKYIKTNSSISKSEFLTIAKKIKSFSSSNGKKYLVKKVQGNTIFINRLDSKQPDKLWDLELEKIYMAYKGLNDFHTINFKKYIPIRHSPSRGLLIHLKLLIPDNYAGFNNFI